MNNRCGELVKIIRSIMVCEEYENERECMNNEVLCTGGVCGNKRSVRIKDKDMYIITCGYRNSIFRDLFCPYKES